MRYSLLLFLVIFAGIGCTKNSVGGDEVSIHLLRSFDRSIDASTYPAIVRIERPVIESEPLVRNADILFYERSTHTFTLTRNIKEQLKDLGADKGFAVRVGNETIYFGTFHPLYLSSITFGVPTIDPYMADDHKLQIDFAKLSNSPLLESLDRRNDEALINALRSSGRLR